MGIGTPNPTTKLDVDGAISSREQTATAAATPAISSNKSLFRLSNVAGVQANAISATSPQEGQLLIIVNEDNDDATFAGTTIKASGGSNSYVYANSNWRLIGTSQIGGPPTGTAGGDLSGTYPNPQIAAGTVANVNLANMAANSVKGNATNASAVPTDIAVGANSVLGRQGGDLVAAQVATAQIADANVTYAKLQNVAATRLLGNPTGSAAAPAEISLGAGLSISGTTINTVNNGTVTSVIGTAPISSTGGTTPAISIPQANTSTNGFLSSADWNTFNSKESALTFSNGLTRTSSAIRLGGDLTQATTVSALTATNKMSFTGTGVDAFNIDGTTLSVDAANDRLGIGTTSPTGKLDVVGGRSFFAPLSEQYGIGVKFVSTGGAVYFGATSNSGTPDAAISNSGGATLMTLQNGGNVGIGTSIPNEKLDVNGNILYRGIINSGGTVFNSTITTKRYYIESRLGTQNRTTVAIDHAVLVELCGDEDGCPLVIGMKNFLSGVSRSTSANVRFFYNPVTRQFRVSDNAMREGTDNNNVLDHAIIHYDCYLTDAPYISGTQQAENQTGMYLLSWNDQYPFADKTCWIMFED